MSTKEFKNEKIEHYKKQFENAKVAVVADYRGLTVEEITELRRGLQAQEADLTVTKNTLCKVAAKGTNFECISELMQGPTAVAFGFGDEVASAKVLAKFIKENNCSPVVKDIWGKEYNVFEDDIKIIFTKSQLKMYKYYDSWDQYKECEVRGAEFKSKVEELKNED